MGCKHFSKTNEYLTSHGKAPINWDSLADDKSVKCLPVPSFLIPTISQVTWTRRVLPVSNESPKTQNAAVVVLVSFSLETFFSRQKHKTGASAFLPSFLARTCSHHHAGGRCTSARALSSCMSAYLHQIIWPIIDVGHCSFKVKYVCLFGCWSAAGVLGWLPWRWQRVWIVVSNVLELFSPLTRFPIVINPHFAQNCSKEVLP